MNDSLFNVIAHEDANDQSKVRQAMALAVQRVEDRFGSFVRQGSVDDQAARFSLVEEDIRAVVAAACEQVFGTAQGSDDFYNAIANNFVTSDATPQLRTASVRHEARKPKMCPYHSEVTDISLAAGDPSAGYNAMSSHAWTGQHCQGGEYEGGKCNFKPAMTTQAFWDEKAEKAEQRRQERVEALENELREDVVDVDAEDIHDLDAGLEGELEGGDQAEYNEPSAIGEGIEEAPQVEVPMAMAASTKTADDGLGGSGVAVPKMDKRKWTPKTVPALKGVDDPDGRNPSKRKDVVEPITQTPDEPDNKSKLTEIGEAVTERQDVTKGENTPSTSGQGGTFGGGDRSAVSSLLSEDAVREALAKLKRD